MKRKAKQSGSGGRLRLGLLMACAAAFLLVPAAQALANGTMTVVIEGGGGGNVTSGNNLEQFIGSPRIECNHNGKTETTSGTCNNELSLEGGLEATYLNANPKYGSEFGGWTVVVGGAFNLGCNPGELICAPVAFETEPAMEVKAVFVPCTTGPNEPGAPTCENPTLTFNIKGNGKGKVEGVKVAGIAEGKPKMECTYASPGPATGVCKNYMVAEKASEEEPPEWTGGRGDALKAIPSTEPGFESEFKGWKVTIGAGLGGAGQTLFCGPSLENATCVFAMFASEWQEGSNMEVTAEFKLKPAEQPLTLTNSGAGSLKEFKCKDLTAGGPEGTCAAKYPEEHEVEVTAIAGTGSVFAEFNTDNSAEACDSVSTNHCVVKMNLGGRKVNAKFNLQTFSLTLNPPIGPGTLAAECEGGACPAEIPYGTEVTVTADPDPLNSVGSFTNGGSANCTTAGVEPEAAATCEFEIKANSEVTVEFVLAEGVESHPANVHGKVPQTTTLESGCGNVDLEEFIPNLQENWRYWKTCPLIATATGEVNVLTAADTIEGAPHRGHLKNAEYPTTYWLPQPLETEAEGEPGLEFPGEGGGTLQPLTSPSVTLLTYGGPVNYDHVLLEFSQWIMKQDPLHTGEYSKTITLTLEQTSL
jgi:hypothetical protein